MVRDEQNARERIAATKDAIAQAEENLRITRVRYQEGVGTATDVLDAITLRTLSETNYYGHCMICAAHMRDCCMRSVKNSWPYIGERSAQ